MAPGLDVLRLCSVFAPPADALARPDAARYDPIGGMQNHVANLTAQLDHVGVRQRVVTSRLGGKRDRTALGEHGLLVRTGLPTEQARQWWALEGTTEALRGNADVVHVHQGEDIAVLPLGLLAARRHGCPLVVTLHTSLSCTQGVQWGRPGVRLFGPALERRALRHADAVITLTEAAQRELVAAGIPQDRVHVLPSGFDPDLFRRPLADPLPHVGRPRVLFVGRLAPQKRPVDVVRAHALLPADVHLVLVGDGVQRAEVEAAVAASPARDRVHVVGFVPHDDVPAYLQHADVFVLPSEYEELGSVLVEAMAARLPVVANRVGGIPDLVRDGETGWLVERGDVPALAATVRAVLDDPEQSRDVTEKAFAHVEQEFAWPALAPRVLAVYEQAMRVQM